MPVAQIEFRTVAIGKLCPNPKNAHTHPKKQVGQIANSIKALGFTSPLLVDEQLQIIAGHGRRLAAQQLGIEDIPVIVIRGLNDAQKRALALADNRIAENGGWSRELLAVELKELAFDLEEIGLDITLTGFEVAEIDMLMCDLADQETEPDEDLPALPVEPVTRPRDLWVLGRHRILCGDTRSQSALASLMDGAKAAMVFADPPYNRAARAIQGRGKTKHDDFAMAAGELSEPEFVKFLIRALGNAARHSCGGSLHYICMDWRHIGEIVEAGRAVYSETENVVVWAKTNAGQGSFYRSQHELIFVFKHGDAPHRNNVELGRHGRNRSNLWSYPGVNCFRAGRLDDLAAHPTVKPIALVADAMRDCTKRGDVVLDPFLGSGTTVLAAEKVGRRGFGIELTPAYVDVAIKRWQTATKQDAVLSATGQTFDEVAVERCSPKKPPVRRHG